MIEPNESYQNRMLVPIRKKPKKQQYIIYGLDTEDDSKGNVTMAGLYNGSEYFLIENGFDITEMIETIEGMSQTKIKHYIFANNMLYDMVNVFGSDWIVSNIENGSLRMILTKIGFVGAIFKRKIYFIDLQNYYRGYSVKKIGELLGVEKLETESKATDIEYMKRDILIHYLAAKRVFELLEREGLEWGLTIGSIALKAWRKQYQTKLYYRHDTDMTDLFRNCYKGGRVEMFRFGSVGKVYCYDVNSLYPFIMMKTRFWRPDRCFRSDEVVPNGMYSVKVRVSQSDRIPLLPAARGFQACSYPVGEFWTYATGIEIILSGAEVLEMEWGFEFDHAGYVFKKFIQDFYNKRLKSENKWESKFYKLIMNNLFGKFGQDKFQIEVSAKDGQILFEPVESGYEPYGNCLWSVQVTAGARIYMWERMNELLKLGYKIYYTDTDSIHTNKPLPESWVSETELGKFECEGIFESGNYFAEKEYYLGDFEKSACKGVPNDFARQFFENGKVKFDRPIKFRESFVRGIQANVWVKTKKDRKERSPKRLILESGETKPFMYVEN